MKKKFCLVGVDQDFNDFLLENKKSYVGLFTKFKNKNYQHIKKRIGAENIEDWKKIKKNIIRKFLLQLIMEEKENF